MARRSSPEVEALRAKCVRLYLEGYTLREVGAKVGRHWTAVEGLIKAAGVKLRPNGHRTIAVKAALTKAA